MENWAKVFFDQTEQLDVFDNKTDLSPKPQQSSRICTPSMTALLPGVHHKATPFRRLLLEVFLVGYRPVPEALKLFLRCKEPLNELH